MKSKEHYFLSFTFLLLLVFAPLYSQKNQKATDQLAQQLQSVSKNNAPDLVYLQTSKTIYETEEDVWFKGYVLDSEDFTPSNRSKTLFVALIADTNDTVVWQKKYEIENGFVDGHLFLKNDLKEGSYTLAAYSSNSFIKEQKEFYALKKLTVVKTITQKTVAIPVEKDSIVHFATFAEGGKLVSDIPSRLAFKAVNSKGMPVDVSGTLFENAIPLISFKSGHAGMGSFDFTPDVSKKYHIELSEPKQPLKKKYEIAAIETSGKSLALTSNTNKELGFKISQSMSLKEERIYLRLQLRGIVYSIATGILKEELVVKIPLNEVPQGIAEVTLFNENGLPLAERLVFVKHDQQLKIQTELNKSAFSTRDKANLKIKVTDENGQAVVAHLGLSVYDAIYQNKADSKTIQSHFLLSTQLKGNIYNPAYYFDKKNNNKKEALDFLLLTQGWRNYAWNEDNLKKHSNHNIIVFDSIVGKVSLEKPTKRRPENDENPRAISVFAADKSKGKEILLTDAKGFFTIQPKDLKKGQGGYTYIKLLTPKNPKYQMQLNDDSFEKINSALKSKNVIYPLTEAEKINPKEVSPFIDRLSVNKLKEVVITKKKGKVFRDKFIGSLDSLAQYRPKKIPTVFSFQCPIQAMAESGFNPAQGKNYPSVAFLDFYYVDQPERFKYENYTEDELLEMFNIKAVEGYYVKKVFYEAVYDKATLTNSTPDYRNTLFWKSDIITDKKGEANVNFFCSDINSLFVANIEGVSGNGLLGAANLEFKVRKK